MLKVIVTFIVLLFSINASAELIDNGDFTTDSIAQRDWLDLSFTEAMSYEQVLLETEAGGDFEGWVIATYDDVIGFFNNAGGDDDYSDTNNQALLANIYPLWGQMPYFENTSWFFVEDLTPNMSTSGVIIWAESNVTYSTGFTDFNESNDNIATALYRPTSVPEFSIEDIIAFFDQAVEDDAIEGRGHGWYAKLRLSMMRQLLVIAGEFIEQDRTKAACYILNYAYKSCDGEPGPSDLVVGDETGTLADMIDALIEELCGD